MMANHLQFLLGAVLLLLIGVSRTAALSLNAGPSTMPSSSASRSLSRSRFLSSTAGSIFTAASAFTVLGGNVDECNARDLLKGIVPGNRALGENPRYLDYELEMKYGEDKGE